MDRVCYCTNVHAGTNLEQVRANLVRYAVEARRILNSTDRLGVGLWFSEEAAEEIRRGQAIAEFRDWLEEQKLECFTLNGFPQGDFHQDVVKHAVYQPTWWSSKRLEYTRGLIQILAELIPSGSIGSISTLPIAWGVPTPTRDQLELAAKNLRALARELARLRSETGKEIVIAIEPEPGCCLGEAGRIRQFFCRYLLAEKDSEIMRKHLTVCHDICHSAVMFEDQGRELQSYLDLGIRIGKVQVSSAIEVRWDRSSPEQLQERWNQLGRFGEARYLHQTTIQSGPAGSVRLVEDLPILLQEYGGVDWQAIGKPSKVPDGTWRVHFHVPIFADRLGEISTTQSEIHKCIQWLNRPELPPEFFTRHWEVETYAWGVLPKSSLSSNLAEGIAEELRWFGQLQ